MVGQRAVDHVLVHIERAFDCGDEARDMRRSQIDDYVNIVRGPWYPMEGARERATHRIRDAQLRKRCGEPRHDRKRSTEHQ